MARDDDGTRGAGSEIANIIIAGLIGALIGAGLGLLLAPKAGAELRSEIREKAGAVAEKAHVVTQKARDLAEAARQKLEERRPASDSGTGAESSAGEKA